MEIANLVKRRLTLQRSSCTSRDRLAKRVKHTQLTICLLFLATYQIWSNFIWNSEWSLHLFNRTSFETTSKKFLITLFDLLHTCISPIDVKLHQNKFFLLVNPFGKRFRKLLQLCRRPCRLTLISFRLKNYYLYKTMKLVQPPFLSNSK